MSSRHFVFVAGRWECESVAAWDDVNADAASLRAVFQDVSAFTVSMEASRPQNGIQLLLSAEQEAQHIVNTAKNAKMARLRQAKEEAEKEIAEFRAQMEAEYQRKLAESTGDSGANVKRLEKETDAKIEQLKAQSSSISPEVVQMLLKYVTTVKN
uniref:V-type proton ATPase subunit G n=2 Tax=Chenopodium quinoa TaxID=63459 RepID=A0A803MLT0_CHEQI